ncbi:unnamed protein product [Caenorhabditis angaria]|uniref:DNA repair and recombination protein RAD54-like n=1 Tax=Caenorhabditis angaria TaxID=860376 RepID=A0A9P1MVT1_9PELO|nr:unnamed protein product [Caenorhabditis angaria]
MQHDFVVGEIVWAKMKGFPPWPAKIVGDVPSKNKKSVLFFGTNQTYQCPLANISDYFEKKDEYEVTRRNKEFQKAIEHLKEELKNGTKKAEPEEILILDEEPDEIIEEVRQEVIVEEIPSTSNHHTPDSEPEPEIICQEPKEEEFIESNEIENNEEEEEKIENTPQEVVQKRRRSETPSKAPSQKRRSLGYAGRKGENDSACVRKGFISPFSNIEKTPPKGLRKRKKAPPPVEPPISIQETTPLRFVNIQQFNNRLSSEASDHNAMIQKLLSRKFSIPMEGYMLSGRSLGLGGSRRKCALFDPYHENAVILYAPLQISEHAQLKDDKDRKVHVVVDPVLGKILRPHQRDGVKFMYDCVTGLNIENYFGCIMADEMGLGKTLQCITLLWTLLRQSPDACPTLSKSIIVCPSSLVKNWDKEIKKWLGTRVNAMPVDSGKRELIIQCLTSFMADTKLRAAIPVLIISYETFRLYANILHSGDVGIVICDEGHRLKNSENLTYQALSGLKCQRRVLISGTPIQNDLLEYFSLVNFVNPGLLGTANEFRKKYENAILKGRDADACADDQKKGEEKTKEMISLVEKCIIRRTSALLTKYLPVKYEHILCCKNSTLQETLYNKLTECEKQNRLIEKDANKGATASALSFITHLKKLCNHPTLVYEELLKPENRFSKKCLGLFPENFNPKSFDPSFSGKMKVLDYILAVTRKTTDDKFVLVSNYTQTIDQFMELCKLRGYEYVRLDGSMSIKQRSKIVDTFNDPQSSVFCFLLSSKAGGCGLNLIGANRLVMFDPDWNPANDDQAMARVWRDGQKKTCFIYRLLATGSIEEKMFQRQTHKKALSSCVIDAGEDVARHFSSEQLKELFKLESSVASDTHEKLKCKRCIQGVESLDPPIGADCASDLSNWFHSQKNARKVADNVLRAVFECGSISFVFHQKSHNVEVKSVEKKQEEADDDYKPSEDEEDE